MVTDVVWIQAPRPGLVGEIVRWHGRYYVERMWGDAHREQLWERPRREAST